MSAASSRATHLDAVSGRALLGPDRAECVKVIHLASAGELGGAELVILDILAGLRESHPTWDLELIVPTPGLLRDRASRLGVHVRVLRWGSRVERLGDVLAGRRDLARIGLRMIVAIPAVVAYVIRLSRALRAARPAIVHAHGFKMQLLAMWAAPSSVPVLLHLHDYIRRRRLISRLLRVRRRRKVVGAAISWSIAQDAERFFGRSVPIRVVYNGIDTTEWTPEGPRLDLDDLAGLDPAPESAVRVGLVATMARWKGHEVFLEAMALLRSRIPVRGYIVGGSIYRTVGSQWSLDELRAMTARLGLGHSVGLTGYVADSAAAMRGLDIVVHASTLPEPFGRVIVEGMATERAVITTAVGGAAELIEAERSALTVSAGSPSALAEAIDRLVGDPAKRRTLGTEGRIRVERLFGRSTMTKAVIAAYQSILESETTAC